MVVVYGAAPPEKPRYGDGKVPSVTQILKHVGLAESLAHIPPAVLEAKGVIGSKVHDAIDAYYQKTITPELGEGLCDRSKGYLRAFDRFRREHKIRPLATEQILVDAPRVGGTVDLIGVIEDSPLVSGQPKVVLDWKTRSAGVKPHDQLQLTGYYYLARRMRPDLISKEDECRLWLVELQEDASYHVHQFEPDLPTWLGGVAVWHWRRKNGLL